MVQSPSCPHMILIMDSAFPYMILIMLWFSVQNRDKTAFIST